MNDIPLQEPYTPELIEAKLKEAGFFRALWRILQVTGLLLAGLFFRQIDRWRWTYRRGETREDRQRRRATWLLNRLIRLGPAFVKVGQSLATRPDLLPLTYIQVLSTLHDQLPSFSNEVALACFEQELGWRPETLFDSFDPEPFAAASLGQVYRLVRQFSWLRQGKVYKTSHEIEYGITSLSRDQASPSKILQVRRMHWLVETGLHYRRDVTFHEDATRMTIGAAGRVLATVHNLVLGLIKRAGYHNAAQARRFYEGHIDQAFTLLTTVKSPS
mgnify:CR=1 FL=1